MIEIRVYPPGSIPAELADGQCNVNRYRQQAHGEAFSPCASPSILKVNRDL